MDKDVPIWIQLRNARDVLQQLNIMMIELQQRVERETTQRNAKTADSA